MQETELYNYIHAQLLLTKLTKLTPPMATLLNVFLKLRVGASMGTNVCWSVCRSFGISVGLSVCLCVEKKNQSFYWMFVENTQVRI